MEINHLDNYNIELSNIWNHEKEVFLYGLQQKEKTKYVISQRENMIDLYNHAMDLCVFYGYSHLNKKQNGSVYLQFRDIYREQKRFKDLITLGWFDYKGKLYYVSQNILIDRSFEYFHFFFALKVDQYYLDVFKMDSFIGYQLEINFNWDTVSLMVFLENLIVQYDFIHKKVRKKIKSLLTAIKELPKLSSEEKNNKNNPPSNTIKRSSDNSYILIGSKTDPDYFLKHNQKFVDIFEKLKENKYIHKDTLFIHFKAIFGGGCILPENRIHWTANAVDLKACIQYLFTKSKIEKPYSGIWRITTNCFIDKNKKEFNSRRLGNAVPKPDTEYKVRKVLSRFP
ncbi:hypothetical protein [Aquimarina sp. I32.4]|uniref:hypothetical protein n=1 Tax=Aquimarina sp. I32.4 TaxID=2053903 RepID=UPI0011AEE8CF|nr:hypothetical protein [Aquimarina sp. I32.4]